MECAEIQISGHAFRKMFARRISIVDVKQVTLNGEIIKTYPDDKPYPSQLIFHLINSRPIHVVVARDITNGICIIVTAYIPEVGIWSDDFKTKIKK